MTTALWHPGKTLATALAVVVIAALALTSPLGSPAHAQTANPPDPRGVSLACPEDEVPDQFPFSDVNDPTFREEISCLAYYGITRGYPNGTYGPGEVVPRDQMASFFARLLDYAAEAGAAQPLPPYVSNRFTDVPGNSTHVEAINRLADAGVIQGGPGNLPDNQYGPKLPVTRAQMASFVNRVQDLLGSAFTTSQTYFPDLAGTSPHTGNINAVAAQGIAVGDASGRFNPFAPTTRQQMAAFVMRHVDANVEAGVLVTPALLEAAAFDVTPTTATTLQFQTGDDASDHRDYTLTNPVAGEEHTIALFDTDNVAVNPTGLAAFDDAQPDGAADGIGAVDAQIVEVGGAAPAGGAASVVTVTPTTDAAVTFVVNGVSAETVVPVVFADADGDGELDVDEDGRPVVAEPYGVGGAVTYQADPVGGPSEPTLATIESAALLLDGGTAGRLDAGDDFEMQFSASVPNIVSAELFFSDGDGTADSVTCAIGPCEFDSDTLTLSVELQGGSSDLQFPLTITSVQYPAGTEIVDETGAPQLTADGAVRPPTPTISTIDPASGAAGTVVSISGTDFVPGDTRVFFGGVRAPDPVVTETEIQVAAPAGDPPLSGPVAVTVDSHRIPATGSASFTYP